jgi:hypothetical protein
MIEKIKQAQKQLKAAQLIGIGIYLLLILGRRYFVNNYQFVFITLLAVVNAIWVFKNLILLFKHKNYILNFNKAKIVLWVGGVYAILLVVLSVLETYIQRGLLM